MYFKINAQLHARNTNGPTRLTEGPFGVRIPGGIRTRDILSSQESALSAELQGYAGETYVLIK